MFHSVPYLTRGDNASLEYWAYDKLGTTASAGCIRLTTADAQWIYYNCPNGTKVEFYSSSNPGPLGKPTARKISREASPYKNWDPTDPNSNNPWKNKPATTKSSTKQETNQGANQEQKQTTTVTKQENTSTQNTSNSSLTITSIKNTTSNNTAVNNSNTNSNGTNKTTSNNSSVNNSNNNTTKTENNTTNTSDAENKSKNTVNTSSTGKTLN